MEKILVSGKKDKGIPMKSLYIKRQATDLSTEMGLSVNLKDIRKKGRYAASLKTTFGSEIPT